MNQTEALNRRDELAAEITRLQALLADKDKKSTVGRRMSPHDYHEWRSRTIRSLSEKIEELQSLKIVIRENQNKTEVRKAEYKPSRPFLSTCFSVLGLLKTLRDEVDLDEEELFLIELFNENLIHAEKEIRNTI